MTHIPHMKIPRTLALALVGLLVLSAVSPMFVGTATANHDEEGDNPIDEILASDDEQEEDGLIAKMKGYVPDYLVQGMAGLDGQLQRAYAGLSEKNPFADPAPTNKENAVTFANSVDVYEDTYVGLVNNESTPSEHYDTHQITFAHEASDPYTVYLVADIKNASVTTVETYEEDEFNKTGRSVDAEWVVDGAAAEDLSELTGDLANHIKEGKPVDKSKQAQLAGKYCDAKEVTSSDAPGEHCDIRSDLWMDHDALYKGVNESAS